MKRQIRLWRQRVARELTGESVSGISPNNQISLYFDGDEAYEAMLRTIATAKYSIHLEIYMFLSDTTGSRFAHALADKARQGVPVRVIYDAIGSSAASEALWSAMREAGVELIEYRPVWFWKKGAGILGRNHRKNLIIDSRIAFTGGMNIGDAWSVKASGNKAWRDTQIKIKGPAAHDINALFIDSWNHCSETQITPPRPQDLTSTPNKAHTNNKQETNGSRCMVIGSRGLGNRKHIRKLYSVHLDQAKRSVSMTVPYFVPPRRLRHAMYRACQRGVSISLLVPRDSDIRVVDWLREGLYPRLLNRGISVREYLGPTLHAKTMVLDDHTAIIGSSNFDIFSVHMNRETAVVVFDETIAEAINHQWKLDLKQSATVQSNWQGLRPWWRLAISKIGCFLIRRL
ncbi:phosphatidylserine/phosphatidylglycerophosphate/cardiolipin synthase family protein [Verrucomicrobiaceae bacterium N1E253]|uniref:Phosphatidylserine/phosphatidylglycerophosphate/ cardiolipin synthase family protein n=1 Tax=Oceaniferula marina TaxID=2748318 RepID=A0A851GPJ5_9BACT|nr:phosphatidylserine/phosphatidylglycerophosphate/cardiolipin synthase family protein [Oceaniferula marina]NWK57045.1 phosphatidylserine/phosphatidylglycerophosphate/cardiolipin synthase family protein [Oceaniferula marina]